jgi:hypothetical protein
MKTYFIRAAAIVAVTTIPLTTVQAAFRQSAPGWCENSGYDNGPPWERGPGTGPYWCGEPRLSLDLVLRPLSRNRPGSEHSAATHGG